MPSKSQQEPYPDPSQPSGSRLGRTTSNISPRSPPSVAATSEANSTRTGKSSLPRHKIQALESFVKFGRKGKENAAEPEFPPDEWFKHATPPAAGASGVGAPSHASDGRDSADIHKTLEETWSASGASPNLTSLKRVGSGFAPSPVQPDVSQAHSDSPSDDRRASSAPDTPMHEEAAPPEPMTLARRIQSLLTRSQPAVPALTNDPSSSSSSGGPITADIAPTDPSLLSLLSNASVMNGKSTGQGVFALLDRLRIRSPVPATSASSTTPETALVEAIPREDEDSDENSSLMLYAPLEPDENSEVELAASDCMSVFDDGETLEFETPARPLSMLHALDSHTPTGQSPLAASALPSTPEPEPQPEQEGPQVESEGTGETRDQTWFGTFRDRVVEGSRAVSASLIARRPTGGEKPTEEESEVQTPAREPVRTTVRWVPSPDKISFQATWWGYRLYLPPPVLEVLNNKRLEAAKRAALITAALQWLLGNVPLTLVPPQFRVGLALTQRLVPYLGYIGAFVAWSWGAMKSFDKGHGITLTATWLLPIALVPGSWEAADFRERERPENSATAGPSTSAAES